MQEWCEAHRTIHIGVSAVIRSFLVQYMMHLCNFKGLRDHVDKCNIRESIMR